MFADMYVRYRFIKLFIVIVNDKEINLGTMMTEWMWSVCPIDSQFDGHGIILDAAWFYYCGGSTNQLTTIQLPGTRPDRSR